MLSAVLQFRDSWNQQSIKIITLTCQNTVKKTQYTAKCETKHKHITAIDSINSRITAKTTTAPIFDSNYLISQLQTFVFLLINSHKSKFVLCTKPDTCAEQSAKISDVN